MKLEDAQKLSNEQLDEMIVEAMPWWAWEDDAPMPSESWVDIGPIIAHLCKSLFRVAESHDSLWCVELEPRFVAEVINRRRATLRLPPVLGPFAEGLIGIDAALPRAAAIALARGLSYGRAA